LRWVTALDLERQALANAFRVHGVCRSLGISQNATAMLSTEVAETALGHLGTVCFVAETLNHEVVFDRSSLCGAARVAAGVTDTLVTLSKAEFGVLPTEDQLVAGEDALRAASTTVDQPMMMARSAIGSTAPIIRYRYDNRGNISELQPVGTASNDAAATGRGLCMQYDARNRLVVTSITVAADAQGQFRDCLGRVVPANPVDSSFMPILLSHNIYNLANQRVFKRRFAGSMQSGDTRYVYGLDGNLLFENTGAIGQSGASTVAYAYLEGNPLSMVRAPTGGTFFFHNNWVGTPQLVTDTSGVVRWGAIYDAWGRAYKLDEDPDGNGQVLVNNLRAPGQYEETETSLLSNLFLGQPFYYNWNRHYMPADGRYMQTDPIGMTGGNNLYGYAEGRPGFFVDQDGLRVTPVRPAPTQPVPLPGQFPLPGQPPDAHVPTDPSMPGNGTRPNLPGPFDPQPMRPEWPAPEQNECREAPAPQSPKWELARGRWGCSASCNVQSIDPACKQTRVYGQGSGSDQAGACLAAQQDANTQVQRGCYKRHCQCHCSKR